MQHFDFDRFAALAQTDLVQFEAERANLIESYLDTVPEPKQSEMRRFQLDLDVKRIGLDHQDFLSYCMIRLNANVQRIDGLAQEVKACADAAIGST